MLGHRLHCHTLVDDISIPEMKGKAASVAASFIQAKPCDFHHWHLAPFRCEAKFGRMADIEKVPRIRFDQTA
jgi:hypothetical protein